MYYIGVDLGTSSVKLLLMDKQGTVVKTVSKEYPISFPKPGWSEQNPYDWYEQSVAGIRELTVGIKKEEVAGISFGGQMHGLVILDENDKVIRPAILWNDGRTTKECEYLNNTIGKGKLTEYTANIAFAGFTAPKILWVREMNRKISKKSVKSCCQRIIWHTVFPVYTQPMYRMHPGCFYLMSKTAAGLRKC